MACSLVCLKPSKQNVQNGVIRLLPLPSEWDGLAVARGLSEEMAGQEATAGGENGAAYMQVRREWFTRHTKTAGKKSPDGGQKITAT